MKGLILMIYRFFDEGTGETLREVKGELTDRQIDKIINDVEDETSCYVLYETKEGK